MFAKWPYIVAWVAFAAVLVAIGALATTACGIWFVDSNHCRVALAAETTPEQRNRALDADLRDLRQRLARAPSCQSPTLDQAATDAARCQPPPADETLILMDVSLSMGFDFHVTPQIGQRSSDLHERLSHESGFLQRAMIIAEIEALQAQLDTTARPDRIDVARDALLPLAGGLGPNTQLRLLSFAECGRPLVLEGDFTAADAEPYARAISSLRLRPETALAEAINALPAQTHAGRDPSRPLNIVILSDGEDSCGGDPCQAAANLRRQLSHAHVSVVTLANGIDANACIADATRGLYLTAADSGELALRLRQTAGLLTAQECRSLPPALSSQTSE